MSGEVIKSFLVGLGFDVDESSLSKFNQALASATLKVTALYASIKVATAAVAYGITKISDSFERMGYEFRLISPAINKAILLRNETLKAYKAAGLNLQQTAQNAVRLNLSIEKTKIALEAIYKSVGARFFTLLTKESDAFRKRLYENMPKIQAVLERMVKFLFKAFEATVQLGERVFSILGRVYDFFVALDKATDGWSTVILAVVAAWRLLNLSFLATPLGMLLTGLVALLALYDDFKTAQEGGKSLINWKELTTLVSGVTELFSGLATTVKSLFLIISDLVQAFVRLFQGNYSGFFDSLKNGFGQVISLAQSLGSVIQGVFGVLTGLGDAISGAFSGKTHLINNLQANPVGAPVANPVGSHAQNSLTNQHVQQQTNINVVGSADANSVGKTVAGEQSRVNFDMVRNLKGATR